MCEAQVGVWGSCVFRSDEYMNRPLRWQCKTMSRHSYQRGQTFLLNRPLLIRPATVSAQTHQNLKKPHPLNSGTTAKSPNVANHIIIHELGMTYGRDVGYPVNCLRVCGTHTRFANLKTFNRMVEQLNWKSISW